MTRTHSKLWATRLFKVHSVDPPSLLREFPHSYMWAFSRDNDELLVFFQADVPENYITPFRLVSYPLDGGDPEDLCVINNVFAGLMCQGRDYPVYFGAKTANNETVNVFRWDRKAKKMTNITNLKPPLEVSTFNIVGDSIICAIDDGVLSLVEYRLYPR